MIDNDVDLVVHVGDLSYANGDPEVSFDNTIETRVYHCVVLTHSLLTALVRTHSWLEFIAESFGVQTCCQMTD